MSAKIKANTVSDLLSNDNVKNMLRELERISPKLKTIIILCEDINGDKKYLIPGDMTEIEVMGYLSAASISIMLNAKFKGQE